MNVHIALYKWKTGATDESIRAALDEIKTLANKVPGLVEVSWGENTSEYSEGYTHVILVRAKDQAAIDAYRNHPDHAKAAKDIEAMEDHSIGIDFTPNSRTNPPSV